MRTALLLVGAVALFAQVTHDPIEVMSRARPKLVEALERLPQYTCVETVNRSYFRQNRARPTCDETLDYKRSGYLPLQATATDRLRLDVAVGDTGREMYSWAGAGRFESASTPEMLGGSPLGTGPFGAFLLGIFGNSKVHFFYEREETADGQRMLAYRYRVPRELSHYELLIGEHRRILPYDGLLFLDMESAELRRLTVHTNALEADLRVCETTTTVDFERQVIGESQYLLPRQSRMYAVGLGTESESVTTWSGCRQYRADSVIHFDDAGTSGQATAGLPAQAHRSLPPGLPVMLVLQNAIDTATAAAGDPVVAKLKEAVVESQSKRVLAPAGAMVRGRIARMEHHLVEPASFRISILFESLEYYGATVPFRAELDSKAGRLGEFTISTAELLNAQSGSAAALRPDTNESAGRTLVFPTSRKDYVVPAGYEMRWVTGK